jgi:hypothetical protein
MEPSSKVSAIKYLQKVKRVAQAAEQLQRELIAQKVISNLN